MILVLNQTPSNSLWWDVVSSSYFRSARVGPSPCGVLLLPRPSVAIWSGRVSSAPPRPLRNVGWSVGEVEVGWGGWLVGPSLFCRLFLGRFFFLLNKNRQATGSRKLCVWSHEQHLCKKLAPPKKHDLWFGESKSRNQGHPGTPQLDSVQPQARVATLCVGKWPSVLESRITL